MKAKFDHLNFNVTNPERSIAFYREALGLTPVREYNDPEGRFKLIYLGDGQTGFSLELTWLRDHPQPYDLGEGETHLCLRVAGDYDEARRKHREMGCICFENEEMGLYFIQDPDGYWIEVLPEK